MHRAAGQRVSHEQVAETGVCSVEWPCLPSHVSTRAPGVPFLSHVSTLASGLLRSAPLVNILPATRPPGALTSSTVLLSQFQDQRRGPP